MTKPPIKVLVLCTGNSARSILGEALFNHLGRGRIHAFSAGSQPTGKVHPVALETLAAHGIPWPNCGHPRSKSWDEFAGEQAPPIDFIFTLGAAAADEPCPSWPGRPLTAHWAIDDPAAVTPQVARRAAFATAYQALEKRIAAWLALPLETLSGAAIVKAALRIDQEAV